MSQATIDATLWRRPATLAEVAAESRDFDGFGRSVRDWMHGMASVSSRPELRRRLTDQPTLLCEQFAEGAIADAYLGAYAEWIAIQCGIEPPGWVFEAARFLEEPWYDHPGTWWSVLGRAPGAFRCRNLFTIPELPARMRLC